jgi:transcriptional regulator with XRE-family HTH domain
MDHNLAFGITLRRQRKIRNKSQEMLAFDAGLDRTYISLLELGQRSPTLNTIFKLCDALNITFSELAIHVESIIVVDDE